MNNKDKRIKVIHENGQSILVVKTRNIALSFFYAIVCALFLWFILYFKLSLNDVLTNSGRMILGGIVLLVLLYLLLRSLIGYGRVTITKDRTDLFEGIHRFGKRDWFRTIDIQKVYVERTETGGGTIQGRPTPKDVKQHIVFKTTTTYTFLHNQVETLLLHELCDSVNEELAKFPHLGPIHQEYSR